jgi:hypothetical protein
MKPVGEPDAGNRHVRFDERGEETERCRMAQATAPLLDSAFSDKRTVALNGRYWTNNGQRSALGLNGFAANDPTRTSNRLEICR